jgi:transcription termination/antitermination protein NusG
MKKYYDKNKTKFLISTLFLRYYNHRHILKQNNLLETSCVSDGFLYFCMINFSALYMDYLSIQKEIRNSLTDFDRKWFVAYTAPRAEKKVAQRLERADVEYFLPVRNEIRQWSDRVKRVIIPAFPSYIFVHVNSKEYFKAISQEGMVKYVHFGGVPAQINSSTIEHIRKMLEYDPQLDLCDKILGIGEKYKIPSGPLEGIEGTVIRLKGKTHFVLEIEEWGKCIMLPFVCQ